MCCRPNFFIDSKLVADSWPPPFSAPPTLYEGPPVFVYRVKFATLTLGFRGPYFPWSPCFWALIAGDPRMSALHSVVVFTLPLSADTLLVLFKFAVFELFSNLPLALPGER